jgi:acyl dehydratase
MTTPDGRVGTTLAGLRSHIDEETGVFHRLVVDQARISPFAALTSDWQFIHVDPLLAARSPFGGTIAHGLLTSSVVAISGNEAPRRKRLL